MNPWLLELTFAAFAALAIPIVQYLWRHWPSAPAPAPALAPALAPAPALALAPAAEAVGE